MFCTLALVSVLIVLRSPLSTAECYQPNGDIASDDMPCNPTAANSFCCATGWACLSDRVCQQIPGEIYYRGTCTDKTWASNLCPSFCLQFNNATSLPLGRCSGSTDAYYCDGDSHYNCDTGFDIYEPPGTLSVLTTIKRPAMTTSQSSSAPSTTSSSTTITSTPAIIATNTATPIPSPTPASTSTLSSGEIAGIVVGLSLAALAAAALAFVAGRRGWFKRTPPRDTPTAEKGVMEPMISEMGDDTPREADGTEVRAQLPADPMKLAHTFHEMPGTA